MAKLNLIAVIAITATLVFLQITSVVGEVEEDSICDCEDKEALYYKSVRQLMDANEAEDVNRFLKDFKKRSVCGSDGKFYESRCELVCKGKQEPESDLKQKKLMFCRRIRRNLNQQRRKGLQQSRKLERLENPVVCICPRHYMPVCASNGITYGNKCTFECERANVEPDISIVKEGKCKEDDQTFL
ncbi:Serine protease inhibitor dipetalogastin [Orchesella cincta]|uniref:Serine protease inhibitor dipetalogastin n=1 Tax=Orchesella cincta TaxID=48709 RepID=A0A1D2MLW1_ORCCI|nr:Serine protease inhibitor dipetalogastin [Orchesella cincta]